MQRQDKRSTCHVDFLVKQPQNICGIEIESGLLVHQFDTMPFEANIRQLQTWQLFCYKHFSSNPTVTFSEVREKLIEIIQILT